MSTRAYRLGWIAPWLSALIGSACGSPDRGGALPADIVTAEPGVEIGEIEGPLEYLFGKVVGVAVDTEGVVYVADAIDSSVRAYDTQGHYLKTIGAEGDGPGEFRHLLGLDLDQSGDLVVRGAFRLTSFRRPSTGPVADSLTRTVSIDGPNPDRGVRGRAAGSTFYGPSYFWEDFQRRGYFYLAYDSTGAVTDTVFVPPFGDPETTGLANYMVNDRGGRNVPGINRAPFEPRPSWDITAEGHVVFAVGDRYEVVEVDPEGDTVRTLKRPISPQPIPTSERNDSARAFAARLDSLPVPITRVRGMSDMARAGNLPEVFPPIIGVQTDGEGNVWVRRWPRAGESVFDVYGPSGLPLREVVVPAGLQTTPAPWVSMDVIAGVLTDPRTGIERVGLFRLPR